MNLRGKRIACFLALPQHTRFFLPIRERIMRQGGEILFIIPLCDYPFELDLVKRKLPFKYYTDYRDDSVRLRVDEASKDLMGVWSEDCFKWDGLVRWPLFKQTWFFEQLVDEYYCLEKFLEVEKPDLFIASHECSRWGKTIGYLTNRHRIPFVTFQEGDYHTDQMAFTIHTEYSTVDLLWGERTITFLKNYGCSADKMFPIGNTHIDGARKDFGSPAAVARVKKELGIAHNEKVVLFLLDILYAGTEDRKHWEQLLRGLEELGDNIICVFKWHPHAFKSTYEKIVDLFKELLPSALVLYTYEPYQLLAIADYCVALGKTTLALEALAFGKPLFSYPNADTGDDPYAHMGVSQSVFPPGNWSNLRYTLQHGVPKDIQSRVASYLNEYFYKLDGLSVDRSIAVMDYIVGIEAERCKLNAVERRPYFPGRFSFVIPSGNDSDALLASLTSLTQNVDLPDWEVVLVVNDESVQDLVEGLSGDLKVVRETKSSLAALYNSGAACASGERLVFMRPGIVYSKGGGLMNIDEESVIGFKIYNTDMTPYSYGVGYDFNFTPYFLRQAGDVQPHAVGGGLIGMSRHLYEAAGGFDEKIANHLIEPDICLKAGELGFPVCCSSDNLACNYRETFFGQDVSHEKWENRARFFAKWVGKLPKDDDFAKFLGHLLKI